jgi:predicted Na+-dependent transporter
LLLTGVQVNPWDIAQSLIVLMLVPLAIGLLMKSHTPDSAAHWQPVMNKISGLAILVLLVVGLGLNASNILSLIGSNGLLALLIFIVGCLLIGMLLGGGDPEVRSVMGLGTAQRNISAAIVVAAQNFTEGDTLSFILVASILLLLVLLPVAKRMGARAQATESASDKADLKA